MISKILIVLAFQLFVITITFLFAKTVYFFLKLYKDEVNGKKKIQKTDER